MLKSINEWVRETHKNAINHGWWPEVSKEEKIASIPTRLCLIHSEVSEALEDFRIGRIVTACRATDGKPEGFASELADVVIRCFDLAGALGIDLEQEIALKHGFNVSRPIRHGGKRV